VVFSKKRRCGGRGAAGEKRRRHHHSLKNGSFLAFGGGEIPGLSLRETKIALGEEKIRGGGGEKEKES